MEQTEKIFLSLDIGDIYETTRLSSCEKPRTAPPLRLTYPPPVALKFARLTTVYVAYL